MSDALVRRHRSFRLLWAGETTSLVGSSVSVVVVPLLAVTVLHASAFEVSAISASAWLPWLVFGLAAGPFVDRVPRRRLMIVCDLVAALFFSSIPIAHALGVLHVGQLLVVAFGAGTVSVLFATAYGRFLLDVVEEPVDRAKANSLLQGSASAARIGGIGLGGLLVQLAGAALAVVADSLSFVVSALCLLRIPEPARTEEDGPREPMRRQVAEGIEFSRRDPLMRPLVLFGGTANFALVGYQSLLIVFLVRTVGLNAGSIGGLMALMSCGGVLGAFLGNPLTRRIGSGRALMICKVGACPFALLIPLTGPGARSVLLVIGGLGVGLGIVAGNVISSGFFQSYTPTDLFARTSATQNVFNYGMIPLGAIAAGSLAAGLGVRPALWVMTALLPASSLFLLASPLRGMRELPTTTTAWQPGDDTPERVP
jgi:MFS family permease